MTNNERPTSAYPAGEAQTNTAPIATSAVTTGASNQPEKPQAPASRIQSGAGVKRPGDRIFEFFSTASATLITVLIIAIGLYLIWQSIPAITRNEGSLWGFFTYAGPWQTNNLDAIDRKSVV